MTTYAEYLEALPSFLAVEEYSKSADARIADYYDRNPDLLPAGTNYSKNSDNYTLLIFGFIPSHLTPEQINVYFISEKDDEEGPDVLMPLSVIADGHDNYLENMEGWHTVLQFHGVATERITNYVNANNLSLLLGDMVIRADTEFHGYYVDFVETYAINPNEKNEITVNILHWDDGGIHASFDIPFSVVTGE